MTTATPRDVDEDSARAKRTSNRFVDCDVHELPINVVALADYVQQPWKDWVRHWRGPSQAMHVHPLGGSTSTNVALLAKSGGTPKIAGVDYELMREELLEKYDVAYAVLTSQFFPAVMRTQPEFATAVASAYNDWVIENWLQKDARLLGSVCIAPQQPVEAAKEIDRVGAHPQMVQVMLPVVNFGYGSGQYHPIFAAAERNGLAIALHQTAETTGPTGIPPRYIEWHANISLAAIGQIYSLVFEGVFDLFPTLRVMVLEAAFSWLPHVLLHADQKYKYLGIETPWVRQLPSVTLRERLRVGTQPIEELNQADFMKFLDLIGSEDMLVFCTDYPHWDSDEPMRALPAGIPQSLREKILIKNALEFYNLSAQ
jgi:predicted TIM-barrel fold metal-dependent hydrolase